MNSSLNKLQKKSDISKPKMIIESRYLRKEVLQIQHKITLLERKYNLKHATNQGANLKTDIQHLHAKLNKLYTSIERTNGIDRVSDIQQIKRYKKQPKNNKIGEYLDQRKKSLHSKLNAPDEILCSDGKVRTKKQAEAWRIQKLKTA